jgi:YfiH family protein
MKRQDNHGLATYHFESLTSEGLVHAVFTRLGGISREPFATLNVSENVGDDEAAVVENRARIYTHLGLRATQVALTGQVHGNRVAVVTADGGGQVFPNTDGLLTDVPGVAFLLRFADCQPILLFDPVHHALGLIHAGWRGIALGIARRALETMREAFGTRPQDLIAGLGPAIGPCCYVVGQNVAAAMGYALPDWTQAMSPQREDKWRFDLSAANAQQLAAAGVQQIEQADLCTACHNDVFFSHRADNGKTGRFAVVAFLNHGNGKQEIRKQEIENRDEEPEQEPVEFESINPPGFPAFDEFFGDDE